MKETFWWFVLLLVLGGTAAALYWQSIEKKPLTSPPQAETRTLPEAKVDPPIRYPILEPEEPLEEAKPLPPLRTSDERLVEALAGLFDLKQAREFFELKEIIRRLVVTIDNLPREKMPMRYRFFKPAVGNFQVTGEKDNVFLSSSNFRRYTSYVLLAEAIDVKKALAIYAHFYPLFQEEYKNLGYPKKYFNDRLVEAIDDMLATPIINDRIELTQPNVLYKYADPELEGLSAGKKIMLRMGVENAARIKGKLREIRRELTGQES